MHGLTHRRAALAAILCSGAVLGTALASERWGGLVPCALCLLERWPYRVAIVLGLAASVLPVPMARAALWLAVLTFLAAAALGGLHVGVEQGFWPSPLPECAAPTLSTGNLSQMLSSMPLRPSKPCDSPTFLIPGLPLSMAAINLIYALVLAIGLATYLSRRPRRHR